MSVLFMHRIQTEGRVLNFRVLKTHGHTPRLQVSQTLPPGFIGQGLDETINICEEDVAPFLEGVLQAAAAMGQAPPAATGAPKEERYAEIRRTHPNAYRPWTAEEDEQLRLGHAAGRSLKEMAAAHGRKVGAIESRIRKLFPQVETNIG